ncbi:VanW family protein [Deinococcus radiophilus]|uniref:Vancomycin resistance protein n=1 Tax=Deinococcus radiophilus TaxID=32062 RepID=A0A3S0RAX3_9DEIO|nr:VanW family protein [Deinococcus radiophilus]RTR22590.1 hypothetical protein EJ104_12710 [Deinococcus radiophilus]
MALPLRLRFLLPLLLGCTVLPGCQPPAGQPEPAAPTVTAPAVRPAAPAAAEPEPVAQPLTVQWTADEPQLIGGQVQARSLSFQRELPRPASADDPAFRNRLEALYTELEQRQPRDIRWRRVGERWVGAAQHGWAVDREASWERVRAALAAGETSVTLAVRTVAPQRDVAWAAAQGLGHLHSGQSQFAGSPDFRVHNIRVGADKVAGQWLEPGETFDFNASVGQINAANGFQEGYVITGDTLSMEDGGGLCQVSTTVFRAAFGAGLPITERHPHSYQVEYYGEPGLDAAVYAPGKNLRWVNDTGAPLLVQAEWNLETEQLFIHLFGRDDGREVTLGDPQITDFAPPPDPTFVADPALHGEEAQRLDMPAPGGRVTVTRRIQRGDQVSEDQLVSRYRPWGGVFAVPPGDGRIGSP